MKAMILAAGLGTRLRPLTDNIPKALVEVDGEPMLKRLIISLRNQGFDKIVVNVHHLAYKIIEFLKTNEFDIKILISDESDKLLDTGGGIVKALPILFKEDREPVLFHNVDILSNADIKALMYDLDDYGKGSSLIVSRRESTRKLLFDSKMILQGWHDLKNNIYKIVGSQDKENEEFSFSGIYAMTYEAISEMKNLNGEKKFSIMDYFLDSNRKYPVKGLDQPFLKMLDIGKPATLSQASSLLCELNSMG